MGEFAWIKFPVRRSELQKLSEDSPGLFYNHECYTSERIVHTARDYSVDPSVSVPPKFYRATLKIEALSDEEAKGIQEEYKNRKPI